MTVENSNLIFEEHAVKDPREVFGRVGIVASGGGLRGVAIPGFLEPLLELFAKYDMMPVYFGSVSVSALIFARLSEAKNPTELLAKLEGVKATWDYIGEKGPEVVFPFSWKTPAHAWNSHELLGNETLFNLLEDFDFQKSIQSPIRFEFTVLDDQTKKRATISNKDPRFRRVPKNLTRGAVCSASFCPIFHRLEIEEGSKQFYRDGGSIDLMSAVRYGCNTIFVLFPYPEEHRTPKPLEGFLGRHLPLIEDFAVCYAAELRTRDEEELVKVQAYNERIADRVRISVLEAEVARLQAEKSFSKTAQAAEGWLYKVRSTLVALLKNRFVGVDNSFVNQHVKPVRKIVLYADPPETLTLTEFGPGDFDIAFRLAKEKMERELDRWLK